MQCNVMHVCMCACICNLIWLCIYVCVCVCMCMRSCMYAFFNIFLCDVMSRTVLPCNIMYCMCMMFILIWYSCGRLASKARRQAGFHITEDAAAWGADCLLGESNTKVNWYDLYIYVYMITYKYILYIA